MRPGIVFSMRGSYSAGTREGSMFPNLMVAKYTSQGKVNVRPLLV
jgi:hypothetical protein